MRGPRVRFPAAAPLVAARTAAGALLAAVALLAPPLARAQAPALEVWVLNEASRSITVLFVRKERS